MKPSEKAVEIATRRAADYRHSATPEMLGWAETAKIECEYRHVLTALIRAGYTQLAEEPKDGR